MNKLADLMLDNWDMPWFSAFRGFLMGALLVCSLWLLHELLKWRKK